LYTLITAATTAQAHKLKNGLEHDEVILGDYEDLPQFMLKNAGIIKLPNPTSLAYAHEMLTLCLDRQIDKIHVLKEDEYIQLAAAKQLFTEFGILMLSDNGHEL